MSTKTVDEMLADEVEEAPEASEAKQENEVSTDNHVPTPILSGLEFEDVRRLLLEKHDILPPFSI